jgi:ATP-dependent Lon protease
MLSNIKDLEEETDLHVITWNTEEYMEESQKNFEELYYSVAELGINLSWEFKNIHARSIVTDHGWKIIPDRGLDIFEAADGRFDVGGVLQERSEVIFMENN